MSFADYFNLELSWPTESSHEIIGSTFALIEVLTRASVEHNSGCIDLLPGDGLSVLGRLLNVSQSCSRKFYLSYLCCCNWIPQTEWLINNKHLFPMALEAGNPSSRTWPIQYPVRVHRKLPFCCDLTWQKGLESSLGLFHKGTNPILKGSTHRSSSPPKGPRLRTPLYGRFGFNLWILERHNLQSIASPFSIR